MKRIIVLAVAVLALACSGSHHSDGSSPLPEKSPLWGESQNGWGEVVCKDSCGCLPPKEFSVRSLVDRESQDLCGGPWDCRYRCHADCLTKGAEAR